MKFEAIALHEKDNVGVLLVDTKKGDRIPVGGQQNLEIIVLEDIRFGHKIALVDIRKGEMIRKYGHQVGVATKNIRAGDHVHIHNVGGLRGGAKTPTGKGGRS